MYDNHIGSSKFREIKSLIGSYINCDDEYHGLSIEEISDRAISIMWKGSSAPPNMTMYAALLMI